MVSGQSRAVDTFRYIYRIPFLTSPPDKLTEGVPATLARLRQSLCTLEKGGRDAGNRQQRGPCFLQQSLPSGESIRWWEARGRTGASQIRGPLQVQDVESIFSHCFSVEARLHVLTGPEDILSDCEQSRIETISALCGRKGDPSIGGTKSTP